MEKMNSLLARSLSPFLDSSSFLFFFFVCVCVTLLLVYSRVRSGRSSTAFALARVSFLCEVGDIEKRGDDDDDEKTRKGGWIGA